MEELEFQITCIKLELDMFGDEMTPVEYATLLRKVSELEILWCDLQIDEDSE
jgi:hypothetical protein